MQRHFRSSSSRIPLEWKPSLASQPRFIAARERLYPPFRGFQPHLACKGCIAAAIKASNVCQLVVLKVSFLSEQLVKSRLRCGTVRQLLRPVVSRRNHARRRVQAATYGTEMCGCVSRLSVSLFVPCNPSFGRLCARPFRLVTCYPVCLAFRWQILTRTRLRRGWIVRSR